MLGTAAIQQRCGPASAGTAGQGGSLAPGAPSTWSMEHRRGAGAPARRYWGEGRTPVVPARVAWPDDAGAIPDRRTWEQYGAGQGAGGTCAATGGSVGQIGLRRVGGEGAGVSRPIRASTMQQQRSAVPCPPPCKRSPHRRADGKPVPEPPIAEPLRPPTRRRPGRPRSPVAAVHRPSPQSLPPRSSARRRRSSC